ncbi:E3 ubiquitin- ligase HUWE1 [Chlorella sorokiniana]|uniref:E3 ubiquitin-protein ligase HACE1 n=1 Tax=Chlorella sorokiniana TaxID=3076 RepID=A0A2P6TD62_CHLSO|nr:E3 ubiquitin- ligase HUWE1 [Chlorella sorokiniana]|eukprot:PRW20575.1 E3 ubiquitin- ligase HUWE1 [Chlorella sorokiniana]
MASSQSFWDSNVVSYWDSQVLSHASAGRLEDLSAALVAGGRANVSDPASAGDSALLLAARGGHPACCRLLLAHGVDADAQGSRGETALMAAIVAGSTELVEALLPATADLALRTDAGLCPMALACLHRHPWALALLLRRQHALLTGAARADSACGTSSGCSHSGTASAQPQQAAPALDFSTAPLSQRSVAGKQLLLAMYAAVASGDASCLQQLADHPLATPAHDAQFGVAAATAAAAAPMRMPGQEGGSLQDGLSFLLDAAVVGQRNVRAASFLWQTTGAPSHLAAATDRPDCLRVLLSSGLSCPDERTNSEGFTPLMLAATADAAAAAAVLLQAGAALEARNHASRTALFLAAVSGSTGVLSLLINAGAQVDAAEQARGYSPLTAAIARTSSAEASRQPQAAALAACAAQLLAGGADAAHAAQDGSQPLHLAAEGGSVGCIDLLVRHGAPIDAADSAGCTPLAGAVLGRAPHAACALRLLEHGASVPSSDVASRLLACLLQGERRGNGDPYRRSRSLVTVWRLLAALNTPQLRALSDCPQFYDLPHTDAPEEPLPAAALAAVLELAAADCSNLLYSASPADCAAQGRRPAYLLELLRRAAASANGDAVDMAAAGSQASSASRAGWAAVRAVVLESAHVSKLLSLWASAQMMLQYASCLARCHSAAPPADRERLSCRVGHLFSAFHALAGLCSTLGVNLTAALAHPSRPLVDACLAVAAPAGKLLPAGQHAVVGAGAADTAAAAAAEATQPVPVPQGADNEACGSASSASSASSGALAAACLSGGGASSSAVSEMDMAEGQPEEEQEEGADETDEKVDEAGSPAAAEEDNLHGSSIAALALVPATVPAVQPAAATPQPCPSGGASPPSSNYTAGQSQEEAAIGAVLRPFGGAIDELIAAIGDAAQLGAWHFVLEYSEVSSLPTKHRLLQSLIAAWPRRSESQLGLTTPRTGLLQRACTTVEEWQAAAERSSRAGSVADVLWHGIKVAFEEENGVGDGVRREWFRLLAEELTDPHTGLFESHDGGTTFSPAVHASLQCDSSSGSGGNEEEGGGHLAKFELIGAMMGLGIMQGCTLPGLWLTAAAWRALLGQPQQAERDLAEADPQLYRSLQYLRQLAAAGTVSSAAAAEAAGTDAEEDGVAAMGVHFAVHDAFGHEVELCPGGSHRLVTVASLEQYIALLSRYKQVDAIAAPCGALARGLHGVVTRSVLDTLARCFSHEELNTLVAGQCDLDALEWRAAARHEGGCERAPQLAWFWAAVEGMCQAQRRQLMAFVTSSSALPAGGFPALRGFNGAPHPFTVSLVACEGDERLPRASTCFNHLFLPSYSSAAVLEERLLQAITQAHAFDEGVIRR